jgi:phosphate acetyltransferase
MRSRPDPMDRTPPSEIPAPLSHGPLASPAATRPPLFDALVARAAALPRTIVAVAAPLTRVALEGALDAARAGLLSPVLVGPERAIREVARAAHLDLDGARIVDAPDEAAAARTCAALCRAGEAAAIMKGSLHTDALMHAVLATEANLRTARRVSHVFALDVPTYSRLLFVTDAAINIYPRLEDKVDILKNAIDLARAVGVERPNVAILSAVETVSPAINSTLDAAALCKMADRGQIEGAVVDGPLAFDTAISPEAAAIKGLRSPVVGVADILLVPDLESGNMLVKQLEYLGGAELAGVVMGARVPVVLTSRADSARARIASCALASLYAHASAARVTPTT